MKRADFFTTIIALGCFISPQPSIAENLLEKGRWNYFADTVMGGVSQGQAKMISSEGAKGIHLSGTVSTENNGGFIQVRTSVDPADVKEKLGLEIRVKGNGEPYYIHIRNGSSRLPWHYYGASFKTSQSWQTIRLPFEAFKRSSGLLPRAMNHETIKTLALVAYGRDHAADVSILKVGFYQ